MTPKIPAEPNKLRWFIPAAMLIALLYFLNPILAIFLFAAILAVLGFVVTILLVPLAVIFALLAFGQIIGFFGVLLAPPASAALLVGLRHPGARYRNSSLYKK